MSNYKPLPKEYDGIKLNLDWFYLNPLKFQHITDYIHLESCAIYNKDEWFEDDCTCVQKAVERVVGRINVFRKNGPDDDKRFFTVYIPGYLEDYLKLVDSPEKAHLLWEYPDLYPPFLKEDIENGMLTLFHALKYYEVTGKEDWMEIDAKELEAILYDKK